MSKWISTNENGFTSYEQEVVYNWLTAKGSEEVAIQVTNFLNSEHTKEFYEYLEKQDLIDIMDDFED